MCTVSWLFTPDGYHLFFSRDELRTRSIAQPPQLIHGNHTCWLSPLDPDGGGSWIAINGEGIGIFLLNNYQAGPVPPGRDFLSRGLIVAALADSPTVEAAERRLNHLDLRRYRPFKLGIISPPGAVRLACWEGIALSRRFPAHPPLISSSLEAQRVIDYRCTRFAGLQKNRALSPVDLENFHRFFDHRDPAASVCMRRDDAATMSLSMVQVTAGHIAFRYLDGQPDRPRGEYRTGMQRHAQTQIGRTAKIASARHL